jgi:membrane protein
MTAERVHPATETGTRTRHIGRALRYALFHLRESQAPTMAANLAFRTLFGLLPVLVVATIVTRALLGDGFDDLVIHATETLGLDDVAIAGTDEASRVPLGSWLQSLAREAAAIDLSAIGLVGALAVLFSAIWTMVAIESSFNAIYRAPSGRPFVRRVLIYWFVITAGPVLFAAIPLALKTASGALGADSVLSQAFVWTFSIVGGFLSLWLLLTAAYATVPNSKVDLRSAIIGAFVATLLVEIGKRFLGASLAGSFSASRLYGSLGLVPLFMLWIYVMWLVVLFGLQVAAILQGLSRDGRLLASSVGISDVFEPAEAIGCFEAICERFRSGKGASTDTLVRACAVSPSNARRLLAGFEKAGLAHRIDGDERRFAPSRPPETILQRDVLRIGFAVSDGGTECHSADTIAMLRDAQLARLGDLSFAASASRAGSINHNENRRG